MCQTAMPESLRTVEWPSWNTSARLSFGSLSVNLHKSLRVQKLLIAGSRARLLRMQSSLDTINRPRIEA